MDNNGQHLNSLVYKNNCHAFNVAKYYKQSFLSIPVLQKYEVIVWLDGSVEVVYCRTSEYILQHIFREKILAWNHEGRNGSLIEEVIASMDYDKYTSTFWNNQSQPFQDVEKQYRAYLREGYSPAFFKKPDGGMYPLGMWITCFVAFFAKDPRTADLLNFWYLQTLRYTTQDQISFPFVCQQMRMVPFTLPHQEFSVEAPSKRTQM
jgi:hypothetical protein